LSGGVLVKYSDGQIWMSTKSKYRFLIPLDWKQRVEIQNTNCIKNVRIKKRDICLEMTMDNPMPEEEKDDLYDPITMKRINRLSIQLLSNNVCVNK
jgi:hypothetical protein